MLGAAASLFKMALYSEFKFAERLCLPNLSRIGMVSWSAFILRLP